MSKEQDRLEDRRATLIAWLREAYKDPAFEKTILEALERVEEHLDELKKQRRKRR